MREFKLPSDVSRKGIGHRGRADNQRDNQNKNEVWSDRKPSITINHRDDTRNELKTGSPISTVSTSIGRLEGSFRFAEGMWIDGGTMSDIALQGWESRAVKNMIAISDVDLWCWCLARKVGGLEELADRWSLVEMECRSARMIARNETVYRRRLDLR